MQSQVPLLGKGLHGMPLLGIHNPYHLKHLIMLLWIPFPLGKGLEYTVLGKGSYRIQSLLGKGSHWIPLQSTVGKGNRILLKLVKVYHACLIKDITTAR